MSEKKKEISREEFLKLVDSFLDPQRTPGYDRQPEPKKEKPKRPANAWRGTAWEHFFESIFVISA
jgi:hypothetical protein